MLQRLPLFPLGLVLFPFAPLPLHIFEQRYRTMVERCLEQNAPFGVVLLRDGVAERRDVTFHMVGTVAQISEGVRLDDGRYFINTVGQRRFRVATLYRDQPYFAADVEFLHEADAAPTQADELRDLYERYCDAMTAATGVATIPEPLPDDPTEFTYWMAHNIQAENDLKQRLLEADAAARLQIVAAKLRAEMALLPERPGCPFEGGWTGLGSWN